MSEKLSKNQEKSEKKVEISDLEKAFKIYEENKVPIILWEQKEENNEFLVQFDSFDSNNILNVILFDEKAKIKMKEVQISIAPSSLHTQIAKLQIVPEDILLIKYLGIKSQEAGKDYKAFVVKKFDKEKQKFVTSKTINQ